MIELNDWLSINKTSGEGNSEITLTASALEEVGERNASITIKTSTKRVLLNLNQVFPDYPPNNQIWYRTSDGYTLTSFQTGDFNVEILSNTYENGLGIITFADDITSIGGGVFSECSSLVSISIPDSVTSIGSYAFSKCSGLTNISLGNGLTELNDSVFSYCTSLVSITIPDSVTVFRRWVFQGCSSLSEITIPDSVTDIGDFSFEDCSALNSIIFGEGVTLLRDAIFSRCNNLTTITFKGMTAPRIDHLTFYNINSTGTLYYPQGSDYSELLYRLSYYGWTGVPY